MSWPRFELEKIEIQRLSLKNLSHSYRKKTKILTQILIVGRRRDLLLLEAAGGLEWHSSCRVSGCRREASIVHESRLCGRARLRRSILD